MYCNDTGSLYRRRMAFTYSDRVEHECVGMYASARVDEKGEECVWGVILEEEASESVHARVSGMSPQCHLPPCSLTFTSV